MAGLIKEKDEFGQIADAAGVVRKELRDITNELMKISGNVSDAVGNTKKSFKSEFTRLLNERNERRKSHILKKGDIGMFGIRLKTIRSKILALMLPLAILAMLVLSFVSYQTSSGIINAQMDEKMNTKLDQTVVSIQKSLYSHQRVAESLAKAVQAAGTALSKEQYVPMLTGFAGINAETFGAGVWFEPYKYKADTKYFGPYVYKDNGKMTYTDDYSNAQYDYPHYDWYTNGMNTDKSVVWSAPYADAVTGITMVTAT